MNSKQELFAISADQTTVLLGLARLLRPRQQIKNGFVLAPLLFSGEFTNLPSISAALRATLLFCLASSVAYIINDWHDLELDRKHPLKSQQRPLASGLVSKSQALALLSALWLVLVWEYFSSQPSCWLYWRTWH